MTALPAARSLVEPAQQQLDLIPSSQFPAERFSEFEKEDPTRNPRFTAARFFARFPEAYREIASLLAEGVTQDHIAEVYKVSPNTVSQIARNEAGTEFVESSRRTAAAHYRHLARLARERAQAILEDPTSKPQLQAVAMSAGIFDSKAAELAGDIPTQRIEVDVPALDRFNALLVEARDRARKMSFGADAGGQKDGAGSAGASELPTADLGPGDAPRLLDAGEVQVGPAIHTECTEIGQKPKENGGST